MTTCIDSECLSPPPTAEAALWRAQAEAPQAGASMLRRAEKWLLRLGASPTSTLCAALAVNALLMPYRGRFHDAILYGMQVANRVENNRYAGDLFLEYGSQDRYSLFSRAALPLARWVGVDLSFLLLYLAATALFFFALQRLLKLIVPNRALATLALICMAVGRPEIGGLGIFHVNENFLTPRLLAGGLVLLGLERMLAGRLLAAVLLLLAALLMHPLMACGGWLVFFTWCVLQYVPRQYLTWLAATAVTCMTVVLLTPAIGARVFGSMDAAWRDEVQRALPCLFGTAWEFKDWLQVVAAGGILLAAWRWLPIGALQRHFLAALIGTTGLSIVGTLLACWLPYALLLQGQPFRALWLAQLLGVPFALMLAQHWWRREDWLSRCAAVLVLGYLGAAELLLPDLLVAFGLLGAMAARLRWTGDRASQVAWPWQLLAVGLCLTIAIQTSAKGVYTATHWHALAAQLDVDFCVRVGLMILPPLLLVLLALGVVYLLSRWVGFGRVFQWTALAMFFAVQTGAFALQAAPALRAWNEIYYGDLRFVQQFLSAQPQSAARPPTVYWPLWRLDYVWFDLQADSYFAAEQLVGNVFARATAMEGERRIERVYPFEIDTARRKQMLISARRQRELERLYGASFKAPPPSLEDLLKLCTDERLDYVVLRQAFPGWYSEHNDDWFIYDCRQIRERRKFERSHTGKPQAKAPLHRLFPTNAFGGSFSGKETRT